MVGTRTKEGPFQKLPQPNLTLPVVIQASEASSSGAECSLRDPNRRQTALAHTARISEASWEQRQWASWLLASAALRAWTL